ncbi:uncharacterized protein LOC126851865 [Cataglyphis hispanica]|uniref:uncharacterized protein LOC126851865 n=1 Tax=Cataglyphis hispanica TaxID=1086592 RepID=UPI00217FD1F1|nr:uncharacterized protein LOC126851865 [Cataglyphis hispanica]
MEIIKNLFSTSNVNQLELDFNIDGCGLDKSGRIQIWPIQCKIVNVQHTRPIIVGIYKGAQKPFDPNIFLQKFIANIQKIMSKGADAPARAFILNHHVSCYPCSKCKVLGIRSKGRYVFNGKNHSLRTDEEYSRCLDEDHHKGNSPLSMLPIGLISKFLLSTCILHA